ncbi:hypothetical protein [Knoellia sp. p5-6-4]|uniref:hypothetical protein n=1 Tax=unclassified Knoellia TaxID=2618719 RepID=UPI0023DB2467|nr:hypothetical protein [Knoellia sp. p5-6-4]MDF2144147.1 hypothetical protein [Knoellia sp. p5-6-4]
MRRDETQLNKAIADAVELDRRTVNRAMAWSVPVVMAAVAAPAAAGSGYAQIGQPTVTATKTGGPTGKVEFVLTFSNTGTGQGTVQVLTVTSSARNDEGGVYLAGLPQTSVVGAGGSAATGPITWDYQGKTPKAATYTFTYTVDEGRTTGSVTFKI